MRRIRYALSLLVVVGSLVAVAPAGAGAAPRSDPRAVPDGFGPWDVGRTTVTLVDEDRAGRTLTVDLWYPVDAEDAGGPPSSLDLLVTTLDLERATADPEPSEEGPFPLVVFSHGSGGVRFQSWFLTEAMASHGYVVAAPDHAGNTSLDSITGTTDPFPVVAANRPRDVSFVLDEVLGRAADPADPFFGVVDGDDVAVAGHSFGGFTALATAGGYGSYEPDPRVDAIIPIAPASGPLSDAELASIDVPTLLLGGTKDVTTPIEPQTTRPWALIPARRALRVDVVDAGHNSFTNVCDLADALVGAGLPPALTSFLVSAAEEGCAPDLLPIEEAQRLTILYAVSFLGTTIGSEPQYRRYLTPRYAEQAGLAVEVYDRRRR